MFGRRLPPSPLNSQCDWDPEGTLTIDFDLCLLALSFRSP